MTMKMLLNRCGKALLLGIAGFGPCCTALAQDQKKYPFQSVDLIQEIFYIATPAARGSVFRGSWTELTGRVNSTWSTRLTYYQTASRSLLDESYVQYESGSSVARAGRFRSAFGFGRWSDMFYNVIARNPMVRMMPVLDRFALLNFSSGIEWHEYRNGWELGLQFGDAQLSDRQLWPEKGNVATARVQRDLSGTLLGLNFSDVQAGGLGPGGQVYGLDFKAFADRLIVRGELVGSAGSGLTSKGYYADISYRPPGNHRLQLGVRLEEYAMGSTAARLITGGARYVPLPWLSMNLNYGWTPKFGALSGAAGQPAAPFQRTYPDGLKGWSLQTMFAFRFRS